MTWSPPPPPGPERPDGPTDAPPWSTPPQLPQYSPGARTPGQPEDVAAPPPPPPQLRYADWAERVGATIIDAALVFGLLMLVTALTTPVEALEDLAGLVWFGAVGYLGWLNGSTGQSPGKALMGLKVVRDQDGATLGGVVGLVRTGTLWVLGIMTMFIFMLVSLLWPLRDAKHRTVHDLMFSSVVVSGYPRQRFGLGIFRP